MRGTCFGLFLWTAKSSTSVIVLTFLSTNVVEKPVHSQKSLSEFKLFARMLDFLLKPKTNSPAQHTFLFLPVEPAEGATSKTHVGT